MWIASPNDREYVESCKQACELWRRAPDVWCDTAVRPPRVLNAPPIALVPQTKKPRRDRPRQWFVDAKGAVVETPEAVTTNNGGIVYWIDCATKRVLEAPPTQLFETNEFSKATQFLDLDTRTLLRRRPGWLASTESAGVLRVWRHRTLGTVVSTNPGLPEPKSKSGTAAETSSATRPGAAIEMLAQHSNPLQSTTIDMRTVGAASDAEENEDSAASRRRASVAARKVQCKRLLPHFVNAFSELVSSSPLLPSPSTWTLFYRNASQEKRRLSRQDS